MAYYTSKDDFQDYSAKNVDQWFADVGNLFGNSQKNNTDYDKLTTLRRQVIDVRLFLADNKDTIGTEKYNKLSNQVDSYVNAMDGVTYQKAELDNYYSQWKSEDEYNNYIKQAAEQKKEYDRLMTVDVGGTKRQYDDAKKRLDVLQNELNLANNPYAGSVKRNPNDIINEMNAVQKQRDSAWKLYNDASQLQKAEGYKKLKNAPDFTTLAQKGLSVKQPEYKDLSRKGFADSFYSDYDSVVYSNGNSAMLTEDEKNIYGYLVATQGEKAANQYLDALQETINYRRGFEQADRIKNNTFLQLASGIPGGIDQFSGGIQQLFHEDRLPTSATQFASGQIRSDLAEKGPQLFGTSLGQVGYDMITTTSNMAPSMLLSGLITAATGGAGAPAAGAISAATLDASAGGNAYNAALAEGFSPEQARSYGMLTGASEGALQYLLGGISKMGGKLTGNVAKKAVGKIDNVIGRIAAETGLSMLGEGTEEYLQEILTPVFRNIAFDENNEFKPFTEEALYSGLMGALSAGLLEGPAVVSNSIVDRQAAKAQERSETAGKIAGQMVNGLSNTNSLKPYTDDDIVYFKKNPDNLIDGIDVTFDQYAQSLYDKNKKSGIKLDGSKKAETLYLGRINNNVSSDINNIILNTKWGGIDTSDYNVLIKNSDIVHMYNQHGTDNRNGQIPLTPEIVSTLKDTVSNPDIISLSDNATKQDKPVLYFTKKINGYSVVLEAVSPSKKSLLPKTMYAFKSDSPEFAEFVSKLKKSRFRNPIVTESRPGLYAQSGRSEALSSPTIPQGQSGVNSSIRQNSGNIPQNRQIRVSQFELDQMKVISESRKIKFEIKDLGDGIDGKYENGTIYINPYAKRPALEIYKHELTHHLEKTGQYKNLKDIVKRFYNETDAATDYAAAVRAKQDFYKSRGKDISWGEAEQETVADFVGDYLFTDNGTITWVAEKKPSLAKSIVNWIREIIATLKGKTESAMLLQAERKYVAAIRQADKQAIRKNDAKYSINPEFDQKYDAWDKKRTGGYFYLGTTSEALESIGINSSKIYWDKSKIIKIQEKHPEMTDDVIKQVPDLLENPMLIMQSQTVINRVTILGEVYADGKPVFCALELRPDGRIDNFIKVASAYTRDNLQHLLDTSDILYVNPDKNKTDSWLQARRLQLPVGVTNYGSIHNVTYVDKNVKGNITFGDVPAKTVMQVAFEKAGYNTSISENTENDTGKAKYSLSGSNDVTLKQRVSGDALLDAQDLIDTVQGVGAEVDENGYITVYHRTNNQSKEKILSSGRMTAKEDGVFFSTKKDGQNTGYGSEIIELKIPAEKLILDDIFDDEAHLRLPLKKAGDVVDVKSYLQNGAKYSLSKDENTHQSDLDLLFDDEFYEQFKHEDKTKIVRSIEELEKIKASDEFDSMSFEDAYKVNTDLKALKAGYDTQYDYIVGREKQRLLKDYDRGSSTVISMIDKKKKQIARREQLERDISESNTFKNAQFEIIQKTNPMWDDYHTGIRSPKDIKTFDEVIDDGESFTWGDFSKEDAQKALKRGTVKVYSSYPIKNGTFVSTSYQQALDYAAGDPKGVHSRVVALESVAWINGDEGQYAKVYGSKAKYSLSADYDGMVEKYGAIKPGENHAREVKVPKQTNDDTKVRQGVRTIMEAKGTPDTLVEELKADIADGIFNYEVISDKEAVSAAKDRLNKWGLQKSVSYWQDKVTGNKRMSKFDFALAEQMYIEAGENGDFDLAQRIAIDMTMLSTEAGQLVQANRLLKNLTPDGRMYKVDKIIHQIQNELDTRFKGKSPTIEVSEELRGRLKDAKSIEEMDEIEDTIMRDISKQLPAHDMIRKWDEWRYLAMLGNPKTHIRNVLGNMLFVPAVEAKNALGMAVERVFKVKQENRTKAFLTLKDKPLLEFAKDDYDAVWQTITGNGINQKGLAALDKYRKVYGSKAFAWLEGLRKFNSNALMWEDKIFSKAHYANSLAQVIKARGWDYNNLTESQLDSAREYAVKEALKATYQDESKLANNLNRLARTNKAIEIMIGGNMPFKKTPINILKRGVEYSPVGFVSGMFELGKALKNHKSTADAIDSICAGLTGTGMMALGIWLSSIGVLKSTADDDKEKTLDRLSGEQEYSLEIGRNSYTIDWIAPMSMPLFIGAEMQKAIENKDAEGAKSVGRLIDAICNISEPMFNLSMLQGLTGSIKAAAYSEQPLIDIAANTVASYATQGVPTLFGQIARSTDTKQRNSYYSPQDSTFGKLLDQTVKKTMAKVPGVSHLLEPYVDKWGQEEEYGNLFLNALENFFSPGYASKRSEDSVTKEIAEIYVRSAESSVVPRTAPKSLKLDGQTYRLQEKEYTAYQKTLGQKSYELVNDYIRSDTYRKMSDAERGETISRLYSYANEKAKKEFFSGRGMAYDDMPTVKKFTTIETAGVDLFDYLYASIKTRDIEGDKNPAGDTIPGSVKRNKIEYLVRQLGFSRREANELYRLL